jgi:hypothetical protein
MRHIHKQYIGYTIDTFELVDEIRWGSRCGSEDGRGGCLVLRL